MQDRTSNENFSFKNPRYKILFFSTFFFLFLITITILYLFFKNEINSLLSNLDQNLRIEVTENETTDPLNTVREFARKVDRNSLDDSAKGVKDQIENYISSGNVSIEERIRLTNYMAYLEVAPEKGLALGTDLDYILAFDRLYASYLLTSLLEESSKKNQLRSVVFIDLYRIYNDAFRGGDILLQTKWYKEGGLKFYVDKFENSDMAVLMWIGDEFGKYNYQNPKPYIFQADAYANIYYNYKQAINKNEQDKVYTLATKSLDEYFRLKNLPEFVPYLLSDEMIMSYYALRVRYSLFDRNNNKSDLKFRENFLADIDKLLVYIPSSQNRSHEHLKMRYTNAALLLKMAYLHNEYIITKNKKYLEEIKIVISSLESHKKKIEEDIYVYSYWAEYYKNITEINIQNKSDFSTLNRELSDLSKTNNDFKTYLNSFEVLDKKI